MPHSSYSELLKKSKHLLPAENVKLSVKKMHLVQTPVEGIRIYFSFGDQH
jgi:hypothetical protein